MRVGTGYDVHPLVKGRTLTLGGVHIPYDLGLEGHSDADALSHAIIDALLGAAALGDIGQLFPSSDPKYKSASSLVFLKEVAKLLSRRGWRIENVDATIVCQKPQLSPYYEQMRANISMALGISKELISIKSTTTDGLDSVGRGEGIAAQAVALLEEGQ